jgi:hypothetical protein
MCDFVCLSFEGQYVLVEAFLVLEILQGPGSDVKGGLDRGPAVVDDLLLLRIHS